MHIAELAAGHPNDLAAESPLPGSPALPPSAALVLLQSHPYLREELSGGCQDAQSVFFGRGFNSKANV